MLLKKASACRRRATIKTTGPIFWIDLAHSMLVLNQYCSGNPPKILFQQHRHKADMPIALANVCFGGNCVAKLGGVRRFGNNRIRGEVLLNQCCVPMPNRESLLLIQGSKIVLQHNRGNSGHRADLAHGVFYEYTGSLNPPPSRTPHRRCAACWSPPACRAGHRRRRSRAGRSWRSLP
jgi:hypothetical protein